MVNVADLNAKITATASGFSKVMNNVAKQTEQTSRQVNRSTSGMTKGFQNFASNAGSRFQNFGSTLGNFSKKTTEVGGKLTSSISKPAGIAATAVGGLVGALGFQRLSGMDQAKAKLEGLGYSSEKVKDLSGQVSHAIEGSMTTMAEGTDVAAGALAAGVKEGKDLEGYIKAVGNAAVGANVPVSEMSQIFNRVKGSGKLAGTELEMMEERLPGFANTMADEMGIGVEEFREKVSAGEVSFNDFMKGVEKRAGNAAEAQSKTFSGMLTNVKNYIGMIGEAFLSPAFAEAKKILADLIQTLDSDELREKARVIGSQVAPVFTFLAKAIAGALRWIVNLPAPVHKMGLAFTALLIAIGPVLTMFGKFGGAIAGLFTTFGKLLSMVGGAGPIMTALTGPLGWIIGAVIALGTAFYIAYQKSETFRNFINGIGQLFMGAIGWIKQFGQAIGSLFGGNQKEGTSILKKLGFNEEQIQKIQGMVASLKSMFSTLGQTLGVIFGRIGNSWRGVIEAFQGTMPFFQIVFQNLLMIVRPIFQTIGNVVRTVFTAIIGIIQGAMQMVQGIIQVFGGIIQGDWGMVWEGVKNVFIGAINVLISLIKGLAMTIVHIVVGIAKSIGASFMAAFNLFKGPIIALFTGMWNGIKMVTLYIWNGIKNAVITSLQTMRLRAIQILQFMKAAISAIWNGIKIAAQFIWNGIKNLILSLVRTIRSVAVAVFNSLRVAITAIWNGIKTVSLIVWNGIKAVILGVIRGIRATGLAIFRALRAGIVAVWNGIKTVSIIVWNGIKTAVLNAIRNIRAVGLAVFRAFRAGIIAVWNGIKAVTSATWNWIKNTVIRLARALKNTALAVLRALRAGVSAIWNGIKSATSAAWNWIKNTVVRLARNLKNTALAVFRALRSGVQAVWNAIKSATSAAWNWIKNTAVRLARALKNNVLNIFRALRGAVNAIWNGIKGATSRAWNFIKNTAVRLANGLKNSVVGTFNRLKGTVSNIWNAIKGNTSKVWGNIKKSVIGMANGIKSGVTGAFDKMKSVLSGTIDKIKGFITDMIDKVRGGLNKLIKGVNWVGEKLGMGKIPDVKFSTGTDHTQRSSRLISNGTLNQDTFATVGDRGKGNGPKGFRHETVIPPKGRPFLTPNKDTTMPLSKGTKILSGRQTYGMLSGSFDKGTDNKKKGFWANAGDAVAGFGKGAAKKVHGAGTAAAKKVGEGVGKGTAFAKSAGSAIAGATAKGTKWLSGKVKDVMDFVKNPGKLLDYILKAFGVNFAGLGKNNIPADMMAGMFTKLKDAAKNLIKQWLEEAEEGSGDASWLFKHPIWQKFGNYTGGLNFNGGKHYGIDFGMPTGTPVKAVADGKVSKVWNDYGGGNSVEVQVGKGLWNWYMHLSKIMAKKGEKVSAGDVIGKSGATGNFVRGAHLHFQLNKGDHSGNDTAINPMSWLKNLSGGGKKKAASKWAPEIKKAAKRMKVNLSNKELQGIIAQIQRESNGNAGVTQGNIGDINNARGTPAQGLLQYVPSTFKAYAVKGHKNIKSGYDQLLAFFNNSSWRKNLPYGKSGWGPTGARRFAEGGIVNAPELAWIAEGGFSESIISHDPKNRTRSKAIHDKTGEMLGIDTDTQLLNELVELMEVSNMLQSHGNNSLNNIANKDTEVYLDGRKITNNVNRNQANDYKDARYNRGGIR